MTHAAESLAQTVNVTLPAISLPNSLLPILRLHHISFPSSQAQAISKEPIGWRQTLDGLLGGRALALVLSGHRNHFHSYFRC